LQYASFLKDVVVSLFRVVSVLDSLQRSRFLFSDQFVKYFTFFVEIKAALSKKCIKQYAQNPVFEAHTQKIK
jgi:hypothetical protein